MLYNPIKSAIEVSRAEAQRCEALWGDKKVFRIQRFPYRCVVGVIKSLLDEGWLYYY